MNEESKKIGAFYLGTSGLMLPVPNKSFYPPEFKDTSRLHYYGALFNSIEINSSFYKIPKPATVAKWAADVPSDFKFSFKLFKEITHAKELIFDPQLLRIFMDSISPASNKNGCLLVQFPPSIGIGHLQKIAYLLSFLKETNTKNIWQIAVEFRNSSLYSQPLVQLMKDLDMTMVIHDKTPHAFQLHDTGSSNVYLRFHGPEGNYKGSYESSSLAEYASYVNDWQQSGKQVYAYFNNTIGNAVQNLQVFRGFTNESSN